MSTSSLKQLDLRKTSHLIYFALAIISICLVYTVFQASRTIGPDVNKLTSLIISISITLPEIAIWFLAARGAAHFKRYTKLIQNTQDGKALNCVANALLLMTAYVIMLTLATPMVHLFKGTSFLRPAIFLSNHLPIVIALSSAVYFFIGSRILNGLVPYKVSNTVVRVLPLLALSLGLFFVWYFQHFEPTLKPVNGVLRFVLPANTLIFTYVLPHIVVWSLGIYACISFVNYSLGVKGAIYKELFRNLGIGVIAVFACIYLAQLIIVSSWTLSEFNTLTILTYVLLLLGGYGFLKIYQGAESLRKIEEA